VAKLPEGGDLDRRARNQMARELLLAQASDWAFIMKTGTMVEYAVKRTKVHVHNCLELYGQIRSGRIYEPFLANLEATDNIFGEIDYKVYA
jgi:1,4-alpha-glucan branching enzyme